MAKRSSRHTGIRPANLGQPPATATGGRIEFAVENIRHLRCNGDGSEATPETAGLGDRAVIFPVAGDVT